jgi:hypothetical protein
MTAANEIHENDWVLFSVLLDANGNKQARLEHIWHPYFGGLPGEGVEHFEVFDYPEVLTPEEQDNEDGWFSIETTLGNKPFDIQDQADFPEEWGRSWHYDFYGWEEPSRCYDPDEAIPAFQSLLADRTVTADRYITAETPCGTYAFSVI